MSTSELFDAHQMPPVSIRQSRAPSLPATLQWHAPALSPIGSGRGKASRISLVLRRYPLLAAVAVFVIPGVTGSSVAAQSPKITLTRAGERVTVNVGTELFTEYLMAGYKRPILYPVNAPGGQSVVRNYPMVAGVEGESSDHPHHQSVWFAHGDVNGLDFWSARAEIKNRTTVLTEQAVISENDWLDGEAVVCSDQTTIRFEATPAWRWIDYQVTITAAGNPVTFGDTKEGLFAIRTHPRLRIIDEEGNAAATAINSSGIAGKEIWGKAARWVHYQNTIGDQVFGISMMDSPTNLRYPNYWHAREYGLIAANPFGLHGLAGLPEASGNLTLGPRQTVSFRYAIVVWRGPASADQIESVFDRFDRRCRGIK
jgi:hypothetical protein